MRIRNELQPTMGHQQVSPNPSVYQICIGKKIFRIVRTMTPNSETVTAFTSRAVFVTILEPNRDAN